MLPIIRHNELLEPDEFAFIERRESKERRQFYKVARIVMVLCFICPFGVAGYNAAKGDEAAFSFVSYFAGVFFLLAFSGVVMYLSFRTSLNKLQNDLRASTKTIEQTHITRKQYMPQNNTYYFYLDSPTRLSIEVSEKDFRRMREGDELNIEYTTHARLYLGYY